jgi:ParB family chromosome partitioning protein
MRLDDIDLDGIMSGKYIKDATPKAKEASAPSKKGKAATDEPVSVVGKLLMLPIDALINDPEQPREIFDEEDMATLADSIKFDNTGIVQPILVRPADASGRYMIIAGERRWRAGKLIGLKEAPVLVRNLTPVQIAYIQGAENLARKDLTPMETGRLIKRLLALGERNKEIAKAYRKDPSWVSNHSVLPDLPACLAALYDTGSLTSPSVLADLFREYERRPDDVEAWAKAHNSNEITAQQARDFLGSLRRPVSKPPTPIAAGGSSEAPAGQGASESGVSDGQEKKAVTPKKQTALQEPRRVVSRGGRTAEVLFLQIRYIDNGETAEIPANEIKFVEIK